MDVRTSIPEAKFLPTEGRFSATSSFFFFLTLCKFFFLIDLFICFYFLAVLSLRCCVQAFSSCSEPGLLFFVVHGLLIIVASLVAERGL